MASPSETCRRNRAILRLVASTGLLALISGCAQYAEQLAPDSPSEPWQQGRETGPSLLPQPASARQGPAATDFGVRGMTDSLAYATAKGGVVNMTRSLAVDLAPDGILVNCVCPGFVDTRMALLPDGSGHEHETEWFKDIYIKHGRIPLRRPAQPDDIAAATSFFCGDDCRYVTGQILLVDGGVSATF